MTKEDILRLRDTAEQTRVQFFDKRSGNAERKERVTRDNKYDVSCEMVAQSNSRGGMIVVGIDDKTGRINPLSLWTQRHLYPKKSMNKNRRRKRNKTKDRK